MSHTSEVFPQNCEGTYQGSRSEQTQIPLVRMSRWRNQQYGWAAYQLPNGEFVMSDRQMASPMRQAKKNAKNFVELHKLPSITIQLPNRQVIGAYPLSTVAAYWQYLVESNLLPPNIRTQINWENLIESLKNPNSKLQNTETLTTKIATESLFSKTIETATSVILKLQQKVVLEVLALSNSEYRLSFESGLSVIGLPINWLLELPHSQTRLKKLENKGFSGTSKQCKVYTQQGVQTVETLSIKDWLLIWEFFACRGNSKAAAILRACAEENISNRVERNRVTS